MSGARPALTVYRALLRAGRSYPDYNIKQYIIRKARAEFRHNAGLGAAAASAALKEANETLELVRRQSIIAGFYKTDKSVMETLNDAVKQETRAGSAPSAR